MVDIPLDLSVGRARVGWWVYVLVLAAAAAFIAHSFVGILTLGVFGYYATRPIHRRVADAVDSEGVAAGATLLAVLLPVVVLAFYAGLQLFQAVQGMLGGAAKFPLLGKYLGALPADQRAAVLSAIQNPTQFVTNPRGTFQTVLQTGLQAASVVANALIVFALGMTLSYFLLKNDEHLAAGFRELAGGRDSAAYAYAAVVDADLESVFFGNFLFVLVMSAVAAVTYWGTNALAPQGLRLPMVLVLAVLTGAASLIPIVVGKVVYLPAVGYLAIQAVRTDGNQLAFVGGALVVYFLVLDILPQTFLQPYITGRQLDMVVMMFAYLLGPILFGWYGFFLMPIVFVLMLEAVRIVLPDLVRGRALTPAASMAESIGTDPASTRAVVGDSDPDAGEDSAGGSE